jgi:hypothetical protein
MLAKKTTGETKLGDTFSTGNVHRMERRRQRDMRKSYENYKKTWKLVEVFQLLNRMKGGLY